MISEIVDSVNQNKKIKLESSSPEKKKKGHQVQCFTKEADNICVWRTRPRLWFPTKEKKKS